MHIITTVMLIILKAFVHRGGHYHLRSLPTIALTNQVVDRDGVFRRLSPQEHLRPLVFGQHLPLTTFRSFFFSSQELRLPCWDFVSLGGDKQSFIHGLAGHFLTTQLDTFLRSESILQAVLLRIQDDLICIVV